MKTRAPSDKVSERKLCKLVGLRVYAEALLDITEGLLLSTTPPFPLLYSMGKLYVAC